MPVAADGTVAATERLADEAPDDAKAELEPDADDPTVHPVRTIAIRPATTAPTLPTALTLPTVPTVPTVRTGSCHAPRRSDRCPDRMLIQLSYTSR